MFRSLINHSATITRRLNISKLLLTNMNKIHISSRTGFSGVGAAEQYHAVRPTYTDDAIEAVVMPIFEAYHESPTATTSSHVAPVNTSVQLSGPSRPLRIVDVGAGTGIFTFRLAEFLYQRAAEAIDYEIYAVEPVADMREQFNRELERMQKDPATADCYSYVKPAQPGSAAALPFPRGFFDGAVAAQALHWFADAQTLDALAQHLTPNGMFCALWNRYAPGSWASQVHEEVLMPLFAASHTPNQETGEWRQALAQSTLLSGPVGHSRVQGVVSHVTAEQAWRRFQSNSVVRMQSPEEQVATQAAVRRVLAETDPVLSVDGAIVQGADGAPLYELNYITDVHWVARKHQVC